MSSKYVVMVSGVSATGKSSGLRNLKDPEGVIHVNCEAGKDLPFPSKFRTWNVTDPLEIYSIFNNAEEDESVHTIVIDTLTFLMDMYESIYVIPSPDGRKAWGDYQQFFRTLMQQYVGKSTKNVIFLAHTGVVETAGPGGVVDIKTMVKIKGAIMNIGVESFFNQVISTKKVLIKELVPNDLLTVTPADEARGFKYCFQTDLTKGTKDERIRGPIGLWKPEEIYIDNDLQLVVDRLHEYYGED